MQIDYCEYYSKHSKLKDQRAVTYLGHVTYFSILGFLNISGISKATNCLKFVNGDDGNLGAELPSWSRAKLIVGGAGKGGSGGFAPRD